ncbi:MAG: CopD family protein [Pseudohongiellaceae bacterium]
MFTVPNAWEFLSLVCKLLVYWGLASCAGGALCLWIGAGYGRQFSLLVLRYILISTSLALHAAVLYFLLQVGGINQNGIAGMFDASMFNLLLPGPAGQATILRICGFFWLTLVAGFSMRHLHRLTAPPTAKYYRLFNTSVIAGILLIALSFRSMGHIATLDTAAQLLILIHVTAMSLWIGSLWPLLQMTRIESIQSVASGMTVFGKIAPAFVGALLVSGGVLLVLLFTSPAELIDNPYGLAVLVKLGAVMLLLGLAITNRQMLVPTLTRPGVLSRFRQSVRLEIVVVVFILLVTAWLSTVLQPPGH